jgi:hypothetical protein
MVETKSKRNQHRRWGLSKCDIFTMDSIEG